MKCSSKLVAISIAVASFVLPVTEVQAHYPPIDDVKPSTLIPSISFDRTPKTSDPTARKNLVAVAIGQQSKAVGFMNESVTLVIPSVGKRQKFTVQVEAPNGKKIALPQVESLDNGNLLLPTLSFSVRGTYKLKVVNAKVGVRIINLVVGS